MRETFLDTQTGAVVAIPSKESLAAWAMEEKDSKRYRTVPRIDQSQWLEIANRFLDEVMSGMMSKKEMKIAQEALEKQSIDHFEEALDRDTDGWICGWDQFRADEGWETVRTWLMSQTDLNITEEFEGCGDCAICQLMGESDGDVSLEALKQAFANETIMDHVESQIDLIQQAENCGGSAVTGNQTDKEG